MSAIFNTETHIVARRAICDFLNTQARSYEIFLARFRRVASGFFSTTKHVMNTHAETAMVAPAGIEPAFTP